MSNSINIVRQFISTLMIAISNCSLYSKEHEVVEKSAEKILSILNECLTDQIEVMVVQGDLIINKLPIKDAEFHEIKFVKCLMRKGISRIDFLKGITLLELKQFIIDFSETDKEIKTYPHIKTGVVDISLKKNIDIDFDIDTLAHFSEEQIEKLKENYYKLSPFKKLEITGLEEIVARFAVAFKREKNILKLLSPVKSFSDHTYVHSTNVAVLSLFQAESLGIKDQLLQDVGLAALLHDVGKLFISKEILDKKGRLDEREFAEITLHAAYGAAYLAKVDGITRLAPIVAFEHHRKYDGTGYPKFNMNEKRQHICSQIVTISDFFDAVRSYRPYKKSWETEEILAFMKKNASNDFNPFLVDIFAKMLLTATS